MMERNAMYKLKVSDKKLKEFTKEEDNFDSIQAGTDLNAMKLLGIHNTSSNKCWCKPRIISQRKGAK